MMLKCNFLALFTILISLFVFEARATGYDSVDKGINTGKINLDEENLVLVELFLEKSSLGETIEIYQHEGGYVVPLRFLTETLEFPIEVNLESKTAQGWFIAENRIFSMNIPKQELILEGKRSKLESELIIIGYDDIYVEASLFAKWFPVDLQLNFADLVLYINPREKLPMQMKFERQKVRDLFKYRKKVEEKNYEVKRTPYSIIRRPFIDAEMGFTHDKDTRTNNKYSYAVSASGDVGFLSTRMSATGQTSDILSSLRITAGRKSYKRDMFGPLKVSEFELGDINSVRVANVSSSSIGRGVYVTNSQIQKADQFDTTNFVGYSKPDWEIEVYRNGELVSFLTVGSDGRYEFNDIKIFYGNNNFRIVSYGPQGQIEERTENYTIDDSILPKGEFEYKFSFDQKSKTVFEVDEKEEPLSHQRRMRAVGTVEYGINDKLTAGIGYVRTPLENDVEHEYQTVSLKADLYGFLTGFNFAYDYDNENSITQITVNTKLFGRIATRGEYISVDDFKSETEDNSGNPREITRKLDLNGRLNFIFPSGLAYRFSMHYDTHRNDKKVITYDNRLATYLFGASFTNNVTQTKTETAGVKSTSSSGSFSIRGRRSGLSIRSAFNYDLEPTMLFSSVSLTLQKHINRDLNVKTTIQRSFTGNELMSFNNSINKDFKKFRGSLSVGFDTEDNFTLGTSIAMSVGHNPNRHRYELSKEALSSYGGASVRAFLDENYNGIYDNREPVLPDVGFKIGGRKYKGEGIYPVLAHGVESFVPKDVEIDIGTLEDPFWQPKDKGYALVTRPGVIVDLDYPIIATTEIDGTIYLKQGSKSRALSKVKLELVDEKGKVIKTTKSEFDGFYLFTKVIPGKYKVRVLQKHLESLKATNNPIIDINIDKNSDIISGIDITLEDENSHIEPAVIEEIE